MRKVVYITIGAILAGSAIFALVVGRSLDLLEGLEDNPSEKNILPVTPSSVIVSVKGINVEKIDDNTANLQIMLDVHNPTKGTVSLEVLHYNVYAGDVSLATGDVGSNLGGSATSQAGINPVIANDTITLKDKKIVMRNNLSENTWDSIVSGKASYEIKGIYSYRDSSGLSTIRSERDFDLRYPILTSLNNHVLKLVQTIPLLNVSGRIDHMDVDVNNQRLFVAALGNDSVEILDLKSGKLIHSISGLNEPQGVLFVPEYNKVFVANGGDGTVQMFDADSYNLIKSVKFSDDADNLRYDIYDKVVYVGYGNGALGIIDAAQGNITGNIKLEGHPESFQISGEISPGIFVNVPSDNSIAVADAQTKSFVTKWSLSGGKGNFPMALDEDSYLLFVGFRDPPMVVVFDTDGGKVISSIGISEDPDDIFYDQTNKRLYVSSGEGFLNVIEKVDHDHYNLIAKIPTAKGARTSLFVPELNRLYV
ncbi:MAG: YncE family protein, partial [Thaumarchaeota archaeon]|nr:YncE family protein [Nitrososphaerota archaeon]